MQSKDDRYLFALEITPISQMSIGELTNFSETDITPNPFEKSSDVKDNENEEVKGFEDCWFCYENPKIEKHLILFEYPLTYIAMPKGPIVQHHFLILPKKHYATTLQCPQNVIKEIEIGIQNLMYFFY